MSVHVIWCQTTKQLQAGIARSFSDLWVVISVSYLPRAYNEYCNVTSYVAEYKWNTLTNSFKKIAAERTFIPLPSSPLLITGSHAPTLTYSIAITLSLRHVAPMTSKVHRFLS